ncbi:MAG TPA: hypothetical protein VEM39_08935 [Myxococcaceae bacterium]|nr:hypothetical protein [Myxococcaceae bacterium]
MRKYIMWSGVVLCFSFLAQAGKVTVKALPSKSGAVNGIGSICDNVPGNLVANCGFETADFTSWAQSGNLAYTGVDTSSANSGMYGGFFGPIGDLGFITQTLPTTAGQTYSLTYYVSNTSNPNELLVSWDGMIVSDDADIPDSPYMSVTVDGLIASGDLTDLTFGFRNDPSYIDLDDVSVVAN